ncbi:hypothetical protein cyc_09022 [Cyclospora cayetanensis]|uniref:Uncharacterized protein n=1 Tax=Cyclospora cayetanensis TaxID=88456 RepID=A0A1D3CVK2_9EIME|nr:hypothetical protein cyc_09022 [Cyclospora cayetanensis]
MLHHVNIGNQEGEPHALRQQLLLLLRLLAVPAATPLVLSQQQLAVLTSQQQQHLLDQHATLLPRLWSGCMWSIRGECEECAVRSLAALIEISKHIREPQGLALELLTQTLPPIYENLIEAIERQVLQFKRTGVLPKPGELPLGSFFSSSRTSSARESPLSSAASRDRASLLHRGDFKSCFRGALRSGFIRRDSGQLVPSRLSVRVAGDAAYCVIALNAKLQTLTIFTQPDHLYVSSSKNSSTPTHISKCDAGAAARKEAWKKEKAERYMRRQSCSPHLLLSVLSRQLWSD